MLMKPKLQGGGSAQLVLLWLSLEGDPVEALAGPRVWEESLV